MEGIKELLIDKVSYELGQTRAFQAEKNNRKIMIKKGMLIFRVKIGPLLYSNLTFFCSYVWVFIS